jgi:hypothetical protein
MNGSGCADAALAAVNVIIDASFLRASARMFRGWHSSSAAVRDPVLPRKPRCMPGSTPGAGSGSTIRRQRPFSSIQLATRATTAEGRRTYSSSTPTGSPLRMQHQIREDPRCRCNVASGPSSWSRSWRTGLHLFAWDAAFEYSVDARTGQSWMCCATVASLWSNLVEFADALLVVDSAGRIVLIIAQRKRFRI